MIGDRYDKDLKPLITLFGPNNIITIRLKKAKHSKSFPSHSITKDLRPTLTSNSFKKIKHYLSESSHWDESKIIPYPRLVDVSPEIIKDEYLEYAKKSKLLILKKILKIICVEYSLY